MKWCRVEVAGEVFYGFLDGEQIVRVDGNPVLGETSARDERYSLDEVKFLAPNIAPVFYAVGFNYPDHIEHAAKMTGKEPQYPKSPEVGYRTNNSLIGHKEAIVKPADVEGRFELEAEIVAIIGKTMRNVTREEAKEGIFGWSIGNDVSARTWQHADRTFWRAKNADTFKPMGPWIDTEHGPEGATTTVKINGAVAAEFATDDMVFDTYDYISAISKYSTLSPGDMIWMGADGATGIAPGDTIDISITGIGTLTNPVVLASE